MVLNDLNGSLTQNYYKSLDYPLPSVQSLFDPLTEEEEEEVDELDQEQEEEDSNSMSDSFTRIRGRGLEYDTSYSKRSRTNNYNNYQSKRGRNNSEEEDGYEYDLKKDETTDEDATEDEQEEPDDEEEEEEDGDATDEDELESEQQQQSFKLSNLHKLNQCFNDSNVHDFIEKNGVYGADQRTTLTIVRILRLVKLELDNIQESSSSVHRGNDDRSSNGNGYVGQGFINSNQGFTRNRDRGWTDSNKYRGNSSRRGRGGGARMNQSSYTAMMFNNSLGGGLNGNYSNSYSNNDYSGFNPFEASYNTNSDFNELNKGNSEVEEKLKKEIEGLQSEKYTLSQRNFKLQTDYKDILTSYNDLKGSITKPAVIIPTPATATTTASTSPLSQTLRKEFLSEIAKTDSELESSWNTDSNSIVFNSYLKTIKFDSICANSNCEEGQVKIERIVLKAILHLLVTYALVNIFKTGGKASPYVPPPPPLLPPTSTSTSTSTFTPIPLATPKSNAIPIVPSTRPPIVPTSPLKNEVSPYVSNTSPPSPSSSLAIFRPSNAKQFKPSETIRSLSRPISGSVNGKPKLTRSKDLDRGYNNGILNGNKAKYVRNDIDPRRYNSHLDLSNEANLPPLPKSQTQLPPPAVGWAPAPAGGSNLNAIPLASSSSSIKIPSSDPTSIDSTRSTILSVVHQQEMLMQAKSKLDARETKEFMMQINSVYPEDYSMEDILGDDNNEEEVGKENEKENEKERNEDRDLDLEEEELRRRNELENDELEEDERNGDGMVEVSDETEEEKQEKKSRKDLARDVEMRLGVGVGSRLGGGELREDKGFGKDW